MKANNLEKFRNSMLQKIKLVESVMSLKPTTVAGSLFKTKVLTETRSAKLTVSLVNKILTEMSNVNDIAIKDAYAPMIEFVNQNRVLFGTALVVEQLQQKTAKNPLHENALTILEEQLGDTNESVKSYIRNGGFDTIIGVNKAILGRLVVEARTEYELTNENKSNSSVEIYHPVSLTESADKQIYFRVENSVFAIDESAIRETKAPSKHFIAVSEAIEKFAAHDTASDNLVVMIHDKNYVITETAITEVNEDCTPGRSFDRAGFITEMHRTIAATGNNMIARQADAAIAIQENLDNVAILDNVNIVKNKRYSETFMIAEHAGTIYTAVLKSSRWVKQFNKHTTISEAVERIKSWSNIDLTEMFESKIKAESTAKRDLMIKKQNIDENINAYEIRLKTVNEQLSLVHENSKAHAQFLKTKELITEELAKLYKARKAVNEGAVNEVADQPIKTKLVSKKWKEIQVGQYISDGYYRTYELTKVVSKNPTKLETVMVGTHPQMNIKKVGTVDSMVLRDNDEVRLVTNADDLLK